MSKFDIDAIEEREYAVIEDMIFYTRDDAIKYINSCDAEYSTSNFYLTPNDFIQDIDIEDLIDIYGDEDLAEEALDEYEEKARNLLHKYSINYSHPHYGKYILSGSYSDLKKFAEEYSNHLDFDNPGEALYDCAEEADIDLESGDFTYVLAKFHL